MNLEAINAMRNTRAAKPTTVQSIKDAERAEIEQQIKAFKKAGGKIKKVKSDVTAPQKTYKEVNDSRLIKD